MSVRNKQSMDGDDKTAMHSTDKKSSNAVIYVVGFGLIAVTALLVGLGGKSAIDKMNRDSIAAIEAVQQSAIDEVNARASAEIAAAKKEAEEAQKALEEEQNKFYTDQLLWAQEYHVHWNEDGNPENEQGVVLDDPTTVVNEVERAKSLEEAALVAAEQEKEEKETETETEPAEVKDWWEGNPLVTLDEDGKPVHIVERGETLGEIANALGFTSAELAEYNGISNPSMIVTGQVIKIPEEGPEKGITITDDMIGLG